MADEVIFPAFDRSMFIPFLDKNKLKKVTGMGEPTTDKYDWGRIGRSEICTLEKNPQTETKKYIQNKNDETTLESYQNTQPQELAIDGNDEMYGLIYEYAMLDPVGSDAVIPAMYAAPSVRYPNAIDGYVWDDNILTIDNIDAVAKKVSFTLNLNGDKVRGEITKGDDGKFTFTPGVIAGEPTQASVFSTRAKKTEEE